MNAPCFFITGGNFANKGAESMLFITVDEIRKRYPDAEIYFGTDEYLDLSEYKFEYVYYNYGIQKIFLYNSICSRLNRLIRDVVKWIIGRRDNVFKVAESLRILNKVNTVIDISGYHLCYDGGYKISDQYLNHIRIAKKLKAPMYIMPQSMGPFNYEDYMSPAKANRLISSIVELLEYPEVVYVREKQGENDLIKIGFKKAVVSPDLVLQNKGFDLSNIYIHPPKLKTYDIEKDSVAILPNENLHKKGDYRGLLDMYREILLYLKKIGKKVYIVKHTIEDYQMCKDIYNLIEYDGLFLINDDISSLEYSELVKQFEFVICSRYHGCVHAFKQGVPCIAIGWAAKYKELFEMLGQGQFVFDALNDTVDAKAVIEECSYLNTKIDEVKAVLVDSVKRIQNDNCYEHIDL